MNLFKNQAKWPFPLQDAFDHLSKDLFKIVGLSILINILVLAPTFYMLQIYSRVISSQSHNTLLMLTLLIIGIYGLLEGMFYVRSKILYFVANKMQNHLRKNIFDAIFNAKLKQQKQGTSQAFIDLKTFQEALVSPVFTAIVDTPIAIFTLIIIFLYDPYLGWLSSVGAAIIASIAFFNSKYVDPVLLEANKEFILGQNYFNQIVKNAQVVESMGMLENIHTKWLSKQNKFLRLQALSSNRAGLGISLSKLIQLLQGSLVLGLGSWLIINGTLQADSADIIVNSMLASRAITPIASLVSSWRIWVGGQTGLSRLQELLWLVPSVLPNMKLEPPIGNLTVNKLTSITPISNLPILKELSFTIPTGSTLAIIGPSASGKTSLARVLVGVWPAHSGSVRLDGVDIFKWDKNELGPYLGYLPQGIELFDGTIAENISRFSKIDMDKVKQAAEITGIDNFINSLANDYQTHIGEEGAKFSAGQRQRIALARAVYGIPKYIVLDEPNSNLDEEGEKALVNTINFMKSQGSTIIIISHRPYIVSLCDLTLFLVDGEARLFGKTSEVIEKIAPSKIVK